MDTTISFATAKFFTCRVETITGAIKRIIKEGLVWYHLHSLHLDAPGVAGHTEHLQHGVSNLLSEIFS